MQYRRFRREGWPIGSGAVEGACKSLIKQRTNLSGALVARRRAGRALGAGADHRRLHDDTGRKTVTGEAQSPCSRRDSGNSGNDVTNLTHTCV